ncbi:cupin domain-containing protein [Marinibacterium profundimaris]|uniref:Cupin type-2 domain-containing protein n=1 Tax=Marinibacterium profundimaris TaxID=1679460 RepID=A0A225NIL6_9RHOB|nr:cupin domain-containing protein [Marinibacterium profundimaris]OWU73675.1 hypothetical protein ATO3_13700 [Marinibacterium profundimaris]
MIRSLSIALSATLSLTLALAARSATAQDLMTRQELGVTETTAESASILSELRMMPGAYIRLHTHPGDEHIFVVKGGPLTNKDGKTITFEDGGYLMFPRGQVHGGLTASGADEIVLITVHVVDKGKPVYDFAE